MLLRFPEGSDLPPMDQLAATRWPGVGRRSLYVSMRDLVAYGHIVKIRYQAAGGVWATDTFLFDDEVRDADLAELAAMFPAGSRVESRRGVERITTDGVEHLEDLPAKTVRRQPGRPAPISGKPSSDRPAITGRSVTGRSRKKTPSEFSSKTENYHHARDDEGTNTGGGGSSPPSPASSPPRRRPPMKTSSAMTRRERRPDPCRRSTRRCRQHR
ncbi:hypothetical protein [Candidatus Frankia alpina]|nr:hypothetical protein [Candidatus Frankia alpina]